MYIWVSHTGIFSVEGFGPPTPQKWAFQTVHIEPRCMISLLQTYFILQTFIYTLTPLSKLETPNYILNPSLKIGSILLQNLVLLSLRSAQSGSSILAGQSIFKVKRLW